MSGMTKIIGGTGHRPQGLGGYTVPNPIHNYVLNQTRNFLREEKPDAVVSGMALGFDQLLTQLCVDLKIPFIAAVPFIGQELLWNRESQKYYRDLLAKADRLEIVTPGGFASWKLFARNKWIVNNSTQILAAFNGRIGGTSDCIEYAKFKKKPITIINPLEYNI